MGQINMIASQSCMFEWDPLYPNICSNCVPKLKLRSFVLIFLIAAKFNNFLNY